MKKFMPKKLDESGLIPLLIGLFILLIAAIFFVYSRVSNAGS